MTSQLTHIYEELLADKKVILEFESRTELNKFIAKLRVVKSRSDKTFADLTGDKLSEGKVIRADVLKEIPLQVAIYLGESILPKQVPFKIIDIQDVQNEQEIPTNMGES